MADEKQNPNNTQPAETAATQAPTPAAPAPGEAASGAVPSAPAGAPAPGTSGAPTAPAAPTEPPTVAQLTAAAQKPGGTTPPPAFTGELPKPPARSGRAPRGTGEIPKPAPKAAAGTAAPGVPGKKQPGMAAPAGTSRPAQGKAAPTATGEIPPAAAQKPGEAPKAGPAEAGIAGAKQDTPAARPAQGKAAPAATGEIPAPPEKAEADGAAASAAGDPKSAKTPAGKPDKKQAKEEEKKRAKAEKEAAAQAARQRSGQKPKSKEDSEQTRIKKEEKARAGRRRNRQLIGLALAVLIVVGAVSIVRSGVDLVRNLLDSEEERTEYQQRFEPLVWFDILPFDSVSQVDENSIKQVAIWGVLSQSQDTLERNDYGEALIPASMVDQYAAGIFGPEFRFSGHESFTDPEQGLFYNFDEETRMYNAPVTSLQPNYLPTVVEIKREGGGVRRVVMGYVSTRTSDDQMIATPDYEHPARYMDFMLRRNGSEYYLYAIVRNTTHTVETPQDASQEMSLPPVDELILPDSSLLTGLEESAPASDVSVSGEDAGESGGEEDGSQPAQDESSAE